MKLEVVPKIQFNSGVKLGGILIPGELYTQYEQIAIYDGSTHSRLEIVEQLLKSGLTIHESREGVMILNNPGEFCKRPIRTGVISKELIMPNDWNIDFKIIENKRARK